MPKPLAIDASTPALAAGAADPWTTASFTPPRSSGLIVCVMADGFTSVPTLTITSTGLNFVSRLKVGTANHGIVEFFVSEVGAAGGSSRTVAAASTGAGNGGVKVWVVTGHRDLGSYVPVTGSGSSTTNSITPNLLTTRTDGSWVFAGSVDWQSLGVPVSSTETNEEGADGTEISIMSARKDAVTALANTTVTMNFDAAGTGAADWNWGAIAIEPESEVIDLSLLRPPGRVSPGGLWHPDLGQPPEAPAAPATNAQAECATVTVTAEQPATKVTTNAAAASATVTAEAPAPKVAPAAGNAPVTAAGQDATVTTVGGTVANAECATVSVVSHQPPASIAPVAATAAVTAAANNPAPKVAPAAANSSVAVTAGSPAPAVAPAAGAAGVTATAGSPAPRVAVNAEVAPVGAAANQPTVLTGTVASAQVATVGVAANGASLSVRTNPTTADVACAVGASGKVGAPAGSAAVAAAALAATPRVGPAPSAALVAVSVGQTSQKVTTGAELAPVLVTAGQVTMGIPDVLATSTDTTATARISSSPTVAASSSSASSSRAGNSSSPTVEEVATSDPEVTD